MGAGEDKLIVVVTGTTDECLGKFGVSSLGVPGRVLSDYGFR